MKAIIIIDEELNENDSKTNFKYKNNKLKENPSFIKIAGKTLIERHIAILEREKIDDITILIPKKLHEFSKKRLKKFNLLEYNHKDNNESFIDRIKKLQNNDDVLLIKANTIIDNRIIENITKMKNSISLIDQNNILLPIALIKMNEIKEIENIIKKFDDITTYLYNKKLYKNINDFDKYIDSIRRDEDFIYRIVKTKEQKKEIKKALMKQTQKSIQDISTLYFYRHFENLFVKLICESKITPNAVTIFGNIIAYITAALFFTDYLGLALFLTFVVGVIDGTDGKLARLKVSFSKFGALLDEISDKIFETAWFFAYTYHLYTKIDVKDIYFINKQENIIFYGIILYAGYVIDLLAYFLHKKFTNVSLDLSNRFMNKFRFLGSRRDIIFNFSLIGYIIISVLNALNINSAVHIVHIFIILSCWQLLTGLIHLGFTLMIIITGRTKRSAVY